MIRGWRIESKCPKGWLLKFIYVCVFKHVRIYTCIDYNMQSIRGVALIGCHKIWHGYLRCQVPLLPHRPVELPSSASWRYFYTRKRDKRQENSECKCHVRHVAVFRGLPPSDVRGLSQQRQGKRGKSFWKGLKPLKRGPTFVFWKGKFFQHGKCKAIVYMQAVWEGCAVVPMILFCNWSYSNWEVRSEEVSRVQPMSCAFLEIFSSNLSQENSPSILSLLFRWNGNARYRGHERQGRSLEKHLAQLAVKLNVL